MNPIRIEGQSTSCADLSFQPAPYNPERVFDSMDSASLFQHGQQQVPGLACRIRAVLEKSCGWCLSCENSSGGIGWQGIHRRWWLLACSRSGIDSG